MTRISDPDRRLADASGGLDRMSMDERPTVLVVEDEPFIREIISDFLEETGFQVRCADTTQSAIDELDRIGPVDAALVDIDLEQKGAGFIVARHAHAHRPEMLIVYTSGGAQARLAQEQVEGSLFVAKPYMPGRLCDLLRDKVGAAAA